VLKIRSEILLLVVKNIYIQYKWILGKYHHMLEFKAGYYYTIFSRKKYLSSL